MSKVVNSKQVNKKQLIVDMMKKLSGEQVTKKTLEKFLQAFIDTVLDNVQQRKVIRILGFLTIKIRHKSSKMITNPKTKAKMKTTERDVPKISAGSLIKKVLLAPTAKVAPVAKPIIKDKFKK